MLLASAGHALAAPQSPAPTALPSDAPDRVGSGPLGVHPSSAVTAAGFVALRAFPPQVRLDGARDEQRLLAFTEAEDTGCIDRSGSVRWQVVPQELARIETEDGVVFVRPAHDGDGELVGTDGERTVRIPLLVRGAASVSPVSFVREVVPILTKSGCNAGSCHGAAAGKNGFALSLFGFDPDRDHRALTRDLRGRRLDVAQPDSSLFLQKASARITHQGGKRFEPDSAFYRTLQAWVARGAEDDRAAAPRLVGIDLHPERAVLVGPGRALPLVLRAHYEDGSDVDVTELALWSSNNEGTLAVDGAGRATSGTAGAANVLARYGGFAVVAQVQVHADARTFAWPGTKPHGFVDELVFGRLVRARVVPAALCDDAVFLRRVHLDLIGVLPTPEEAAAFLADTAPDKRTTLVDRLLERPEFATLQAMSWAEVLQVDAETMEPKGAAILTRWLQAAFAEHRPFDAVVRDLLTAEGATFTTPAANFYAGQKAPHLVGEQVAQVFLGVRLQCAQCHNHPFENWSMDDYYGFAAFFGQLGRKRGEDPTEWIVHDRRNGEVRHALDERVVAPKFLGGDAPKIAADTDRRSVLARWLTAADNAFFARNVANRVWSRLFGRGIVEPVDDVRVSNPPSHPELLGRLASLLVEAQFDLRPLYRAICSSRTYQAALHPDAPPAELLAGNQVRRLSAEQMLDAIGAVTGVPTRYPGLPLGAPATSITGGRTGVRFLDVFGRPERTSSCTCDRSDAPTLNQTLHLTNGDTIATKIAAKEGRLQRALAAKQDPAVMLDDLFLSAYSRRPSSSEAERLLRRIREAEDPAAAWQDLYWAVLNSREFMFQH